MRTPISDDDNENYVDSLDAAADDVDDDCDNYTVD